MAKKKELSGAQLAEAQQMLDRAAEAQTAYFEALNELEAALGFDLDFDFGDLQDCGISELIEGQEAYERRNPAMAANEEWT